MDINPAMKYVMKHAGKRKAEFKKDNMCPEYLFLGLLKLSKANVDKDFHGHIEKEPIDNDIKNVAEILTNSGINPNNRQVELIRILKAENASTDRSSEVTDLLVKANKTNNREKITAADILTLLINEPTPILASCVFSKDKGKKATGILSGRKQILSDLTGDLKKMRHRLLDKVYGQDHAIHAFAEGIFNADVLAPADINRKAPSAIFVLAGPPGVGKTFLAEQAAGELGRPFKRLDMSSYSDHQAHSALIGFAPSYKESKPGILTGFVEEYPNGILLFDEIEKAHPNTIQLFLQILDAGILHDDFSGKTVPFKDTIIIFTTNAGKQLYEDNHKINAAGLPRQTILNALENSANTSGGQAFPAAICSRLATGYLIMFNNLRVHDLIKINESTFNRLCLLFKKQYGIDVSADLLLANSLLFAQGGSVDARVLKAQTELFFKNEIFKLCRLWDNNFESALSKLKSVHFRVKTENLPETVKHLFEYTAKQEILIFGNFTSVEILKDKMPDIAISNTSDINEAFKILGERDINLVLLELCPYTVSGTSATIGFDNIPIAAEMLSKPKHFFETVRDKMPELPVYLLETNSLRIDNELQTAFVRAGVRGKLVFSQENADIFIEEIKTIVKQAYLQKAAISLASQQKILSFETAPTLSTNRTKAIIHLKEMNTRRVLKADDYKDALSDIKNMNVRFSNVVGVPNAKSELQTLSDYLKNPERFNILGITPPQRVLLHGPTGTGKTLLVNAMAGESDVAFFPVTASSLIAKEQGDEQEAIKALFEKAKRYAPAIIFIDEIDAIGKLRTISNTEQGTEKAFNALLSEMDSFKSDKKRPVFVLVATNYEIDESEGSAKTIDPALVKRFDRAIMIGLPDKNDRECYIRAILNNAKNNKISEDKIKNIAQRSEGLSFAKLEQVLKSAYNTAEKNTPINDEMLEEAFYNVCYKENKYWDHHFVPKHLKS